MREYFPSSEQIRRRADDAKERPSRWRHENLQIAREFLSKMKLAGVEATTKPPWDNGAPAGLVGWGIEADVKTILVPGSPPFWWVVDSHYTIDDPMSMGHFRGSRVELEDLPQLATWNPSELRDALLRHVPR